MKRSITVLLSCTLLLSLAGCAKNVEATQETSAAPSLKTVSVTHSLGVTEVPHDPQKIAVLDLAALDILDSLGLGERITGVPKKSSVSYLTSYVNDESIVNLGSVKEVDMEALNSLEPDIIFIGGRLSSEYENLSKIAPAISVQIDHEKGYMDSFRENINSIASIFGKEEQAVELLSGFEGRLTTILEASSDKTAIVGIVTSSSLSTLGNATRCSLISKEAGFENIAADVDSTHGDSASFELLLDKNPDYIFVLDRDSAINSEGAKTAKEVMENEIVMKTKAYQNNTIIYLTPDVWYLAEGGIHATDVMIQDLEAILTLPFTAN